MRVVPSLLVLAIKRRETWFQNTHEHEINNEQSFDSINNNNIVDTLS